MPVLNAVPNEPYVPRVDGRLGRAGDERISGPGGGRVRRDGRPHAQDGLPERDSRHPYK